MSTRELDELKKSDPFLFYSIPEVVRKAALRTSDAGPSMHAEGDQMIEVRRKSRISFECHADLLFEDSLVGDSSTMNILNEDDTSSIEDEMDIFLSMLSKLATSRKR